MSVEDNYKRTMLDLNRDVEVKLFNERNKLFLFILFIFLGY